MMRQAEQLCERVLVNIRADNAQSTDHIRAADTHVRLAGYIVEVDPLAVLAGDNALCTQNGAVSINVAEML